MPIRDVTEDMFRGDGRDYEIEVTDKDDDVVNIAGAKIWFTLKNDYDKTDANAEFQLTTDVATEILITDAANGLAEIYIKNTHTKGLVGQSYYFDIQIKETGREVRTLLRGSMKIKPDVTINVT